MRTILERLALSVGFTVAAALAIWTVLRTRTRLRGKLDALHPLSLKEPDALYRDGRVIAHVHGATVDEVARAVHFEHLTSTVNLLNLGPDILGFRSYRLQCVAVESMTGTPPSPYRYNKVTCSIVGRA